MTNVQGTYLMTISASENGTFHVTGSTLREVDILNNTSGDIYVANDSGFTSANGVANYITIPSSIAFNDLHVPKDGVYIKTLSGSGSVVIARCS